MGQWLVEKGIEVAYGGGVFVRVPDIKKHIAGHYLGDDIGDIHARVDTALSASSKPQTPVSPSPEMVDLYNLFQSNRASLGIALLENTALPAIRPEHLDTAHQQLSRTIASALSFGNLNYLQEDLTWIQGLLSNLSLPPQVLSIYLEQYAQAVKSTLGDAGQPISDALQQIDFEHA